MHTNSAFPAASAPFRNSFQHKNRPSPFRLGHFLNVHLIFQPQIICDHRDKLRVCRLTAIVLNGVPKIRIQYVHIPAVPRYLYRVPDSTFNSARRGLILLRDRRIQNFSHRIDYFPVVHRQNDSSSEILISLDVRGHSDLVNDLRHLRLKITRPKILTYRA